MKPGERVTLVHGLPPNGSEIVTVIEVSGSKVDVRTASGGWLRVQHDHLVAGSTTSPTHRLGDMATAVNAGLAVEADLTNSQWLVLDALGKAGPVGLMDCEHEPVNGLRPDSAGKRRIELQRFGLVEDTHQRRVTPRNRRAQVWRLTALGVEVWQREARRRAA